MANPDTAVYLYCVVRSSRRPRTALAPAGVPDAGRLDAHHVSGSLWVVAAAVPMEMYGPDRLEARLRDLDWVSKAAVAHEGVVEHFARARGNAVVPLKLFTMFSTIDKAVDDIRARKRAVERAMRHVAGAEEWGIRVFRRPAAGDSRSAARSSSRASTPSASGTAFLTARKHARDAAARARATAAAAAETSFRALRRHAKDARLREKRQEPGSNPPVLEASFLVTSGARAKFKAEARRQAASLASAGADLALSGPWPAYNFVTPLRQGFGGRAGTVERA